MDWQKYAPTPKMMFVLYRGRLAMAGRPARRENQTRLYCKLGWRTYTMEIIPTRAIKARRAARAIALTPAIRATALHGVHSARYSCQLVTSIGRTNKSRMPTCIIRRSDIYPIGPAQHSITTATAAAV